jgi:hypothetical protein
VSSAAWSDIGPASTSLSSSSAVLLMMPFARSTLVSPGSSTMISSPADPYGEMIGSETPSSFTRRSIV